MYVYDNERGVRGCRTRTCACVWTSSVPHALRMRKYEIDRERANANPSTSTDYLSVRWDAIWPTSALRIGAGNRKIFDRISQRPKTWLSNTFDREFNGERDVNSNATPQMILTQCFPSGFRKQRWTDAKNKLTKSLPPWRSGICVI